MKLIKDLGRRFPTETSKQKARYGLYECPDCLKHFEVQTKSVTSGRSTKCRSCSSKIANTRHDLSEHKLYSIWAGQKDRCTNPENKKFKDYGARGIKFHITFEDISVWLAYVEALENAYKDTYSIDRIDNDKGYEPGNLRWASRAVQSRNTRVLRTNNTSGYRGVTFNKRAGKWTARIRVNYNRKNLGYFDTALEAGQAYDKYVDDHNLEHTKNFT